MVYISTDFDGQQSTDYTLLIKVGQAEDVLAIVDEEARLKLLTIVDPQQPQPVTDLLNLHFDTIKIVAPDQGYVLIPAEVFETSYLPVYSRYLPHEGLAEPQFCSVDSLGINIVYQLNRLGLAPYTAAFPHALVCPAVQSFLCSASAYAQAGEPVLAIDKTGTTARIAFFDSAKFCYCNDFEVHEAADLNYHLLAVMEHLNLAEKRPQLFLSGDIDADDALYQCAAKYAREVALAESERLTGVSVPADLKLDQHRLLSLLGLHVCE